MMTIEDEMWQAIFGEPKPKQEGSMTNHQPHPTYADKEIVEGTP